MTLVYNKPINLTEEDHLFLSLKAIEKKTSMQIVLHEIIQEYIENKPIKKEVINEYDKTN